MYYFASDIHLGAGTPAQSRRTERLFLDWLDTISSDAEALFLLGDLFDFWFEYRRVVPKGHVRVLARLARLAEQGVRVVFLTGNHDMWVGDYLSSECGIEIHRQPLVIEAAGKRIFLAHGDNMNIDSQPMLRLMNAVFRSRTLRWLFSWLVHPDWAVAFGHWWSGQSRKAHEAIAPSKTINGPLDDYARSHAADCPGIDCYLFGHMHSPEVTDTEAFRVVHLGCWTTQGSYAVLDDAGRLTLKTFPQ